MKLLILTMDYPRPDGTHARMYVHVRNLYYVKHGLEVTVLNFASNYNYEIDGIKVITLKTYEKEKEEYDIAVSHASNIRNHYRFLKKYESLFSHIVFFFHGHEVLYLNKSYPKPYSYMSANSHIRKAAQAIYDYIKIRLWSSYYKKLSYKADYVFVSKYIYDMFKKNTHLTEYDLNNHIHIIHNSIGEVFESATYNQSQTKKYDFITIRSNIDGSTYCVDLLMQLAKTYTDASFLLIGRGKYFDYHDKPSNVTWINKTISHAEMVNYMNQSRCAITLTRQDTQGVMTCEQIAFGIPVITSDIMVCKEFFLNKPNVRLVSNEKVDNIIDICDELEKGLPYPKDTTFFGDNTIIKEVELFNFIMQNEENI